MAPVMAQVMAPVMAPVMARALATLAQVLALLVLGTAAQVQAAADPAKVRRVELRGAESTLDPARASDVYSGALVQAIYESPLAYDYAARPLQLVPALLEQLPVSPDGGRTWPLALRSGLQFAPDPVFGPQQTRAITADDLRYSLERLKDAQVQSPFRWLWTEHLARITVQDRLHLTLILQTPDPQFLPMLALAACAVVPREIAGRSADALGGHPVGSGPYLLAQWQHGSHFSLLANPRYRARRTASGRPIPAIGRVEVQVIDEPQSAWLSFRRGELDLLWLQDVLAPVALASVDATFRVDRMPNPVLNYFTFNVRDADWGGMQAGRVALRRAVLMAIDDQAYVREVREGQAQALDWPVPPGLPGAWPGYHGVLGFDPAAARSLLDQFAYRVCQPATGLRCRPDGRQLTLRVAGRANSMGRSEIEFLRRALAAIGVQLVQQPLQVADYIKSARACQLQFSRADWFADLPRADDFFQLLSARKVGTVNYSCFDDVTWDAQFAQAVQMQDAPARQAAYARLARQAELLGVWKPSHASVRNTLVRARVRDFQAHPFYWSVWQYLDLDP